MFKEHPVIVAQGSTKTDIHRYYIQIEGVLIDLPAETKFIEAVDYLTRSYYVFNIEFPKILSVFMNFVMIHIYDITIKSKHNKKKSRIDDPYTRTKDFWRRIQQYINSAN